MCPELLNGIYDMAECSCGAFKATNSSIEEREALDIKVVYASTFQNTLQFLSYS